MINDVKNQDNLAELWIVRHGQTESNQKGIFQGQSNSALTDLGKKMAADYAKEIQEINFAAIFSSDLGRAVETAEILKLERAIKIQTTALIRERNLGILQGKRKDQLTKKLQNLLHHLDKIKQETDVPEGTNIEPIKKMNQRILTFLRETAVAYPGKKILIITHGGVIGHLLVKLTYKNIKRYRDLKLYNLATVVLQSDGIDFFIKDTHNLEIRCEQD